jgi:hypothetical protein
MPYVKKLSGKICYLPSHRKTSDKRPTQTYVGLTENEFKTRYTNHKVSFNNYEKRNSTELSKYIWNLKNNNISYSIKWKILKRAKSYNNASKRCNLCIWEKYFIICKPDIATLNRRNELVSTCRSSITPPPYGVGSDVIGRENDVMCTYVGVTSWSVRGRDVILRI